MAIVKWDPGVNLFPWHTLDTDLDEPFSFVAPQRGLKVHETEKYIIVEAVVAGVPDDNVEVNMENGVLTIKAENKEEQKSKNGYRSSSYQYYYTTALSGGEWDKAEAEVEHGIVKVIIPKAQAARPRKITVKSRGKK